MLGTGTLGVVLFTMGYVMDRLSDRRKREHEEMVRSIGRDLEDQ